MSVSEVTVGELDGRRDVTIIDVREPAEFSDGHVPGARNIPLGTIADHAAELRDLGTTVYVICQSGRRSAQAAAVLDAADVRVVNVVGGTGAWIATGREVES
ncbi:rhodanese-like domain-containing protein [Curtobacterium ammoniigenes]|uniref:rhodanese-like domain-containing protein n=1 Tax=Curtobacterium ammoniigenes TaxID=395387 RepID=UPI000833E123|nr:rhodanese-like domain-containing protein [Curtobacterium ammoniigenes]